jgi:hypothetical protein
MPGMLDRVITAMERHLERELESALRRGMHFPATWDPFFADYMTLAGIYHYPTQHFASTSASSHSARRHVDASSAGARPGGSDVRLASLDTVCRESAAAEPPSRLEAGRLGRRASATGAAPSAAHTVRPLARAQCPVTSRPGHTGAQPSRARRTTSSGLSLVAALSPELPIRRITRQAPPITVTYCSDMSETLASRTCSQIVRRSRVTPVSEREGPLCPGLPLPADRRVLRGTRRW